jgi:hypothetical protein
MGNLCFAVRETEVEIEWAMPEGRRPSPGGLVADARIGQR